MPRSCTETSRERWIWIGHVDHGDDFRWITDHPSLIRELWPGVTDQIGSYSRILISSVWAHFMLTHSSLISERLGSLGPSHAEWAPRGTGCSWNSFRQVKGLLCQVCVYSFQLSTEYSRLLCVREIFSREQTITRRCFTPLIFSFAPQHAIGNVRRYLHMLILVFK